MSKEHGSDGTSSGNNKAFVSEGETNTHDASTPLLNRDEMAGKWAEQDGHDTGRYRKGGRRQTKQGHTSNFQQENGMGVVLCGVRSPANVGSIMRLCGCFGTADILHVHYAPNDDTNRKYWGQSPILQQLESCSVGLLKQFECDNGAPFLSVGVSEFVSSYMQLTSPAPTPLELQKRVPIVVLEAVAGAVSIHDFSFPKQCKIMVGSEHKGVLQEILQGLKKGVDAVVFVPMVGSHHSMNVASAMTVALYEYRRQWPGSN